MKTSLADGPTKKVNHTARSGLTKHKMDLKVLILIIIALVTKSKCKKQAEELSGNVMAGIFLWRLFVKRSPCLISSYQVYS